MCGIFAIYNSNWENNLKDMVCNLKRLQHRGKDGYGLVYHMDNLSLITIKGEHILSNLNIV